MGGGEGGRDLDKGINGEEKKWKANNVVVYVCNQSAYVVVVDLIKRFTCDLFHFASGIWNGVDLMCL